VARLRRNVLALWLVAVATLTLLLAGLLARAALIDAGALTSDMDKPRPAVRVSAFAAFLAGLGGHAFAGPPRVRLAPVPEDVVARLAPFPGLIGPPPPFPPSSRG